MNELDYYMDRLRCSERYPALLSNILDGIEKGVSEIDTPNSEDELLVLDIVPVRD